MIDKKQKSLVALLCALCFVLFSSGIALAERLESDSFVITFGNFNVTSGEKSSASYNVTDTVGQIANGPYGSYGSSTYFIGSGFQYIYQIDTFAFSISDVSVELGELNVGSHNTASNELEITTKGAGGYIVYAYEEHPLRHLDGSTEIADTSCDGGTCTISNAEVWVNTSVPGFGYNMSGDDVPSDFVDGTYFRPFADDSVSDPMQIVMTSPNIANQKTATVTYKAGIESIQAAGDYQTNIRFVAVPGY